MLRLRRLLHRRPAPTFKPIREALDPELGNLPEQTLFVPKNGLSAMLMAALWLKSGHPTFYCHVGDDPDHRMDVENVLSRLRSSICYVNPATRDDGLRRFLAARAPHGGVKPRPTLVHPLANSKLVGPITRVLPFHPRRLVVQHGTLEMQAYVEASAAHTKYVYDGYFLMFEDRILDYLARRNVTTALPLGTYPALSLPNSQPTTIGKIHRTLPRSLFAVQYLLEAEVLSEDELKICIDRFLERRPPMHYLIKSHPKPCQRTIEVFASILDKHKLTYVILPTDVLMIETAWLNFDCGEISTFYSTSAMICNKLYGVPYDTMLPELISASIKKPLQRTLMEFLHELFYVNRSGTT